MSPHVDYSKLEPNTGFLIKETKIFPDVEEIKNKLLLFQNYPCLL